ncbi:MAG: hypothetical protein ACYC7D_04625 [Nitrososphaerales archaeon]
MSEVRFNGRIRRAAMHTEVSRPNDTIWISGFKGWMSVCDEVCVSRAGRAISHETLHLILRKRVGLRASKTLDSILNNDLESVDYHGLEQTSLESIISLDV